MSDGTVTVPVGGTIDDLSISPLTLTPAFSPSIADYYVRCDAGSNDLTLSITTGGSTSTSEHILNEGDAIIVGDNWVRCLPHDFPNVVVTAHPDVGTPTPGYYLVSDNIFAAALDVNGTPVWYERELAACDVDSFSPDTLSYLPNAEFPYAFDGKSVFDIHSLDTGDVETVSSPDAPTDEHELRVLDDGTFLLFSDPLVTGVDLTGLSTFGSDETIADCEIEQVDGSGNLLWSWRATDHVDPVKESVAPGVNKINGVNVDDVFHCNAIDVGPNNDLLVSQRHTSALYDIDRGTGTVQWKLGGTAFSKDGAPHLAVTGDDFGGFNLQHDARFTGSNTITLFDDHGLDAGAGSGVARGLELQLDHGAGTATVSYQVRGKAESQFMGSFRRDADGHSVVGWGYVPTDARILTEVDADGNDVLDVGFVLPPPLKASDAVSYRAIKVPLSQLDHNKLRAAVVADTGSGSGAD
nr:arylsulfotransferase family protein [Kofleriaceae bacterium]